MYQRAIKILREYEDELNKFYWQMVRDVIFVRRKMNRIKWSRYR